MIAHRFNAGDIVKMKDAGLRIVHHYNSAGQPFLLGRLGGRYGWEKNIERKVAHTDAFDQMTVSDQERSYIHNKIVDGLLDVAQIVADALVIERGKEHV